MSVRVTQSGLEISGRAVPLISGSIHYWRHERELWPHLLDQCQEMGFRVLCTYIPWSIHEIEKGRFDFGEKMPEKDVGAFLDLAHERGFSFIVRPGPHINSELTYFGYPKRVLLNPAVQARSPAGTPVVLPAPPRMFPVPSHHSEVFIEEVGVFLDALAPILKPRFAPQGPIALIQIDNEWSYFFRYSAYEQDYSPGALAAYREYLSAKYGEIRALNKAYGTRHQDFSEIFPPTRFEARTRAQWPRYLDWIDARRHLHIEGLGRIKKLYEARGLTPIPTSHNFPVPFPQSPLDVAGCEEVVDIQGTDHYPKKTDYLALKKEACLLAGSSRLPFVPEFSSGFVAIPTYPITLEDERFTTLALFMHGLKAINLYMLVERERWAGSPVTRDGRRRKGLFEFYRWFTGVFSATRLLEMEKRREVVILTNRQAEHVTRAASVLPVTEAVVDVGALPAEFLVDERDVGLGDRIPVEYGRLLDTLVHALGAAQIPFDIACADSIPPERLSRYRAAVLPCFDLLSEKAQEKLRAFAGQGGHLVVGPRLPSLGEDLEPCGVLASLGIKPSERRERFQIGAVEVRHADLFDGRPAVRTAVGEGSLTQFGFCVLRQGRGVAPELVQMLGGWFAEAGIAPLCPASDPEVETSLFEKKGLSRVLFVANPGDSPKEVRIGLAAGLATAWRDLDSGEELPAKDGSLALAIPPYTVRMLWEILEETSA